MRGICIVLVAACSAPSPDAACKRWADALCARLDGCGGSVYGDATICRTREALTCELELNSPATGDGISHRDACAAALTALDCGALDTGACAPAAGSLQHGAQCRFHSQCASAHCAIGSRAPCGVCVDPPQAGDSCGIGCNGGFGCDPITLTCMPGLSPPPAPLPPPLAREGEHCDTAMGPACLPPGVCLNDGGSSFAGTCTLPDGAMCAHAAVPRNPGAPPPPFTPTPHDTNFQVASLGGPVLRAPQLITVTYDGYAFRDQVEAFGNYIVGSDWMTAVGKEYGIAHGTHLAVRIPSPAPSMLTDEGIIQQLAAWQADGTLPSPGPDTIYMLYVRDADTHVTGAYGIQSCVEYYGYHYEAGFVYALVASCAPAGLYDELEQTEITAAHELAEAATDPYPYSLPAYQLNGVFTFAGELGDLCQGRNDRAGGFAYQRIWSNRAAAAGGDPCVPPNPAEPYFRVEISPQVTKMAIGETRELTFTAWSTAPIGELEVVVYYNGGTFTPWILNPYTGGIPTLAFGVPITLPDAPVMTNGVSGHLTFTLPATARPGEEAALSVFARSSYDVFTTWPFVITAERAQ